VKNCRPGAAAPARGGSGFGEKPGLDAQDHPMAPKT
jgi:hypothetical protein